MSLTDEMMLNAKLKSLGVVCSAFDGLTTYDQRRESFRGAVSQVPEVTYTVKGGKRITMQQQFDEIYGTTV